MDLSRSVVIHDWYLLPPGNWGRTEARKLEKVVAGVSNLLRFSVWEIDIEIAISLSLSLSLSLNLSLKYLYLYLYLYLYRYP